VVKINQFIVDIIESKYKDKEISEMILNSPIIKYLDKKTASVNRSSKSRGSFGNLYAIYVLVEDYIKKGFLEKDYSKYEGADFTPLFNRQRELPFGQKLQNHALNHRCNEEFSRYFPELDEVPIIRDPSKGKYWINEKLININGINIAKDIIKIIDKYVELKLANFNSFFDECVHFQKEFKKNPKDAISFIRRQLDPNVDARIFEIVSFCLVKYKHINEKIFFGRTKDSLEEVHIEVFRTGRTNANDGGIDFIMKPLGRIFQVTEELNFKKYFLDIDKLNKYPITFVIKTNLSPEEAFERIIRDAAELYGEGSEIYHKYIECFEELITIPTLEEYLDIIIKNGNVSEFFEELVLQCKVEYNIPD
jgi:hypothetical protein